MTDNIDKYVDWELERHSWLSRSQAKRVVEENLADDPEFYAFIEDEVEEDEHDSENEKPCSAKDNHQLSIEIRI